MKPIIWRKTTMTELYNVNNIKPRETTAIINSLLGGVVPKVGVQHIAVGRSQEIQAFINTNNLTNVQLLGHKTLPEVYNLITNAQFTVCPSEWYENYPFSVIEAMSFKKAIVGARIGGIPELIQDGKTGLLFESFNPDDLREKIVKLWNDDEMKKELGENAQKFISHQVSYERHYGILKDIYSNLNVAL